MQSRDVTIPLVLWICAAVCAHFLFGTGGLVVAQMHDDRSEMWKLSHEATSLAKQEGQTFEVSLGSPSEAVPDEVPPPPPPPPPPKPEDKPKPKPTATQKPTETKTPDKKPEDKKAIVLKKDEDKKPAVLPEDPLKDRRIAVRQHATADQQDNPTAHFIADQANHVEHETVATQTSTDRDD